MLAADADAASTRRHRAQRRGGRAGATTWPSEAERRGEPPSVALARALALEPRRDLAPAARALAAAGRGSRWQSSRSSRARSARSQRRSRGAPRPLLAGDPRAGLALLERAPAEAGLLGHRRHRRPRRAAVRRRSLWRPLATGARCALLDGLARRRLAPLDARGTVTRRKATASTPSAGALVRRRRRPRRFCSRWTRAGGRWPTRPTSSTRVPPRREAQRQRARRRRPRRRIREVAHLRERSLDPDLLGRARRGRRAVLRAARARRRARRRSRRRATTALRPSGSPAARSAELRRLTALRPTHGEAARRASPRAGRRGRAWHGSAAHCSASTHRGAMLAEAVAVQSAAPGRSRRSAPSAAARTCSAVRTPPSRPPCASGRRAIAGSTPWPCSSGLVPAAVAALASAAERVERRLARAAERARSERARARAGEPAACGDGSSGARRSEVELQRDARTGSERASRRSRSSWRTPRSAEATEADAVPRRPTRPADPSRPSRSSATSRRGAALASRIDRLERAARQLGAVNPLAKEEYEEEKERLDELATQRTRSRRLPRGDRRLLRDELAATVAAPLRRDLRDGRRGTSRRSRRRCSPAARAVLRLVEADDDGGGDGGARAGSRSSSRSPAGKQITRLTLLSGGEKALGAISFLFALFLAKPCPFYLLDEVEAALDDANVDPLRRAAPPLPDQAQFIVITHQKRTMEAADVLYGVTMGDDGVSRSSRGGFRAERREAFRPAATSDRLASEMFTDLVRRGDSRARRPARSDGGPVPAPARDPRRTSRRALTAADRAGRVRPGDDDVWEQASRRRCMPRRRRRAGDGRDRRPAGAAAADGGLRQTSARRCATAARELLSGAGRGPRPLGEPPTVVLVVGVNGTGKTTTVGKLARAPPASTAERCSSAPRDTFRAAADEQLETWAERAGADFVGSAARAATPPPSRSTPSTPARPAVATS